MGQVDCSISSPDGAVQLQNSSRQHKSFQLNFRAKLANIHVESRQPAVDASGHSCRFGTPMFGENCSTPHQNQALVHQWPAEEAGSATMNIPALPIMAQCLVQLIRISSAHAAKYHPTIHCSARVSLKLENRASGWAAHPAVTDNALQLGPATSDVGKEDNADVTRVVAGLAAYVVTNQASICAVVFSCLSF